ncbi:MAG: NAD(P)/FAD-dependent oxidoreductase [Gemmatimonadaceae bacterium]
MSETYDLVVLGTGSGGSAPASKCRAAGWRVAVVDDQSFGGTCANRGCDPKKVLVGAADVVAWNLRMRGRGVSGDTTIDWASLMKFKQSFTDPVPVRKEASLTKAGIEFFHGAAHFISEDRLVVGDRVLTARHVVIATGARPRPLGIPGDEHVINSTEFLELPSLPRRVAFIGAGYIAMEFSHIARTAGAEVTVLGRDNPLPAFDETLVARLVSHSQQMGIDVRLGSSVTAVQRLTDGSFRVSVGEGTRSSAVIADLVVHGAGRVPNTAHLAADVAGVRLDRTGAVDVNAFLQSTTNPRVYAAGDVTAPPGSAPLTPVAGHEGAVVASNLLHGNTKRADYRAIPSVVFTLPPLASVGLTEAAARSTGTKVRVASGDTGGWYTNRRVGETVGMFKTIIDADSDLLLGAHVLGTHAEEVINLFAVAMRFGVPVTELRHTTFGYPSAGSDLPYML